VTTDYATCRWHPDRRAGVICQRCDAPICPSCMHQASVGFHCPDCSAKGGQKVYTGRAAFSGANQPIVTRVLVGINVALFVLMLGVGERRMLIYFGANGLLIDEGGEWYRIVTSAFLHWGLIHLAFNMWALWNIGPAVERALGRVGFGVVYAAALMGGSAGALLVKPAALTAGASGAIFGLLGALVILYRRAGIDIWRSGLGLTLGLNLLITVSIPQISIGGHLGGFVGGLLATWLLVEGPRLVRSRNAGLALAAVTVPVFAIVALVAASTWANPIFG
jgi:membrane associated rhomboid family serine protease